MDISIRVADRQMSAVVMPSRAFGILVLCWLFAVCVYRASTQSVTHDEALAYHSFLNGRWTDLFTRYDVNHHILHTYLCKISLVAFGVSALALRLPALIGALLYFALAFRVSEVLFVRGSSFVLSLLLLCLHPLILDFLACARGYGLAQAFFLLALTEAILILREPARPAWPVGIAAALSIGCNLTLFYPCAALMTLTALALWKRLRRVAKSLELCASVAFGCTLIIGPFLRFMSRDKFYAGAATTEESLVSLFRRSLPDNLLPFASHVLVPVILGLFVIHTILALKGKLSVALPTIMLLLTLLLVVAAHLFLHVLLPMDRTGLFLLVLFSLSLAGLFDSLVSAKSRIGAATVGLMALFFVFSYLLTFRTSYFAVWWYDAGTKQAAYTVIERANLLNQKPVHLLATVWLFQSLEFYKRANHWDWMQVRILQEDKPQTLCYEDYYLLISGQALLASERKLRVLQRNPVAGLVVATPENAALWPSTVARAQSNSSPNIVGFAGLQNPGGIICGDEDLDVSGWIASRNGRVETVRVILGSKTVAEIGQEKFYSRPDVAKTYRRHDFERSGWSVKIPRKGLGLGGYEMVAEGVTNYGEVGSTPPTIVTIAPTIEKR